MLLYLLIQFNPILTDGAPAGDAASDAANTKTLCHNNILRSYLLHGRFNSQKDKMITCPEITNNCCTKLDQQRIYHIVNDILPERVEGYQSQVWLAITKLKKLHKTILKHKPKFTGSPKRRMFCSTEAQRIYTFPFESFLGQLRHAMDEMQYEMNEYYKSFYCNICNGDNQRFFTAESKQINFNADFCQHMLTEHEDVLQMFNVELVKYLVSMQHLVDCNHYLKSYNLKFFDSKKEQFADEINNCLLNAGSRIFLKYCNKTCSHIMIARINYLFEGDYEFLIDAVNLFEKFFEYKETGNFMSMKLRMFFKKYKMPRMLVGRKRQRFMNDLKNREKKLLNRKLTIKNDKTSARKLKLVDMNMKVGMPDETVKEVDNLSKLTKTSRNLKSIDEGQLLNAKNNDIISETQEQPKQVKSRILDSISSPEQKTEKSSPSPRSLLQQSKKPAKAALVSNKELQNFYSEISIEQFESKKYIFKVSPKPTDLDTWIRMFTSSDGLNPERLFGNMAFNIPSSKFYSMLFDYRKPDNQDVNFLMLIENFDRKYFLVIEEDLKKRFTIGKRKKKKPGKMRVLAGREVIMDKGYGQTIERVIKMD